MHVRRFIHFARHTWLAISFLTPQLFRSCRTACAILSLRLPEIWRRRITSTKKAHFFNFHRESLSANIYFNFHWDMLPIAYWQTYCPRTSTCHNTFGWYEVYMLFTYFYKKKWRILVYSHVTWTAVTSTNRYLSLYQ